MKKLISLILASTMILSLAAGCGSNNTPQGGSTPPDASSSQSTETKDPSTASGHLKVAALESAYGTAGWEEVVAAFSASHPRHRG